MDDNCSLPCSYFGPSAQKATAAGVILGLVAVAVWYWGQGELVEIERATPLVATFQVDVNAAAWPEIAQLPGIGETIARRIVADREKNGRFGKVEALSRVRGIGRKKLEQIRPYLRISDSTVPMAKSNPAS